jgi:hypothetical protein
LFVSPGLQAWESAGISPLGRPSGLFAAEQKGLKA